MTISFSKPKLPSGWYYPTEKDNVGTWKEYKKQTNNNPFHFKADFNGDQKEDEAWLLLRTNKNEYGLFVFLMKTDSCRNTFNYEFIKGHPGLVNHFIPVCSSDNKLPDQ